MMNESQAAANRNDTARLSMTPSMNDRGSQQPTTNEINRKIK